MKSFIIAVVAAFTLSTSAIATDLLPPQPNEAEFGHSWGGLYGGVELGIGALTLEDPALPLGADTFTYGAIVGYDMEVGDAFLVGVRGGIRNSNVDLGLVGAGIDEDMLSYDIAGRAGVILGAERNVLVYVGGGHRWAEADPVAGLKLEASGMFAFAGAEMFVTDNVTLGVEVEKSFLELDKPAVGIKIAADETRGMVRLNYRFNDGLFN